MPAPADDTLEDCPVCKNGAVYSAHNKLFRPCVTCAGRGKVVVSLRCACGSPVLVTSLEGYRFCGRSQCLLDLKTDRACEKYQGAGYYHAGFGVDGEY